MAKYYNKVYSQPFLTGSISLGAEVAIGKRTELWSMASMGKCFSPQFVSQTFFNTKPFTWDLSVGCKIKI